MNPANSTQSIYTHAIITSDKQVFQHIHASDKNIAVCQRDIEGLRHELDQLMEHTIEFRASGSSDDIIQNLKTFLDAYPGEYPKLLNDAVELLGEFETIT